MAFSCLLALQSCQEKAAQDTQKSIISDSTRIVSISGATTEILCELGFANNIVGLDITSTYPDSLQNLPKVGYNRNIALEGIMSLEPDLVIGLRNLIEPDQLSLLQQSGLRLFLFEQEFSAEGAFTLIQRMADTLGRSAIGADIINSIKQDMDCIQSLPDTPTVLFLYARGPGTISVAGRGTQVEDVIRLAGGRHARLDYDGFKPLSPEILVEVNPQVVLMFDTGLSSISGHEGLQQVPGMRDTDAGRNNGFVAMDGVLLTSYGPRLGKAVCELNQKLLSVTSAH